MSILRTTHSPTNSSSHASFRLPLRVFASGTLFLTHKLLVPSYPEAGDVARAQSVQSNRGGHGANVLAVLAQFRSVRSNYSPSGNVILPSANPGARSVGDVQFSGPLAGNEEGSLVVRALEAQGVAMMFSIVREEKGVPSAWVIEADGTKTVINHNPLPDMTHDEFVSRLGPILAPENYDMPSSPPSSHPVPAAMPSTSPHAHVRRRSGSGHQNHGSPPKGNTTTQSPYSQFIIPGMPPFDWMHFEGRALQTTLANITGLDGLARERGWRSRCVFSLQVARAGVEGLIQYADVIFFSKSYAQAISPSTTPRSFLISMSAHASPNALLIADWGSQGAALLSIPTREYLQSSGWVEPAAPAVKPSWNTNATGGGIGTAVDSVRTGSGFWADGRPHSGFTATGSETSQWVVRVPPVSPAGDHSLLQARNSAVVSEEDSDSRRTSLETERGADVQVVDEVGAHEAFVAGMIFALSQRILPGRPYIRDDARKTAAHAPVATGTDVEVSSGGSGGSGRWRLEECLRFATELAGRKGRRMGFGGLRLEMEKGGWVVE